MSFILDALRKSETERQQKSGPGLADVQYRSPGTGKNFWIPLLVIVLAANAVVVAWVMNTGSQDSAQNVEMPDQSARSESVESGEIRPLAREVIDNQYAPVSEPGQAQNIASNRTETTEQQFGPDISISPGENQASAIQDGLPSLQQLVLAGDLSVQPMHLDIHVYAKMRTERFIFINMKKYKEGDNLAEGPSVEEITSTGVILSYRGKRFTLDRD
jgi:general secretion pathway protein B